MEREQLGERLERRKQRGRQRADAELPGELEGLRAGARLPQRRVRRLERLGHDVALGDLEQVALPRKGVLRPHLRDHQQRLAQLIARGVGVDSKGVPLVAARSREPQLEPSTRQAVHHRGPLRDSQRVIDGEGRQDPRVTEADALGVLGHGRHDQLRRARVAELGRAVVLHGPPTPETGLVGQANLLERLVEDRLLVVSAPVRPRLLQLREQIENHADLHFLRLADR